MPTPDGESDEGVGTLAKLGAAAAATGLLGPVAAIALPVILLALIATMLFASTTGNAADCNSNLNVGPGAYVPDPGKDTNPTIVAIAMQQARTYVAPNGQKASTRVIVALFETGLAESNFRNLANTSVPISMTIANDGAGHDHDSVGYLQQRVNLDGSSRGWGTVQEAMDPVHATNAFLERAINRDADPSGDAATVAQDVQISGTDSGNNYRSQLARAEALIAAVADGSAAGATNVPVASTNAAPPTSTTPAIATTAPAVAATTDVPACGSLPTTPNGPGPPVSGKVALVINYALAQLGKPYVFAAAGPDAFDCSGLSMMAWKQAGVNLPHLAADQWHMLPKVPAGSEQPGDLYFEVGADGTTANPGHVGIVYDPTKKTMIEAYGTGYPLRIASYERKDTIGFARPS